MLDRLKALFKDIQQHEEPQETGLLKEPTVVPKGCSRHCTFCGKAMRMYEGGSYTNEGRRQFDGATGRPIVAYVDVWSCPDWNYMSGASHDRVTLSDLKSRWA